MGRSGKATGQAGDEKSQSQLEESLGAVAGPSTKKSGLALQKA